MDEKPSPSRSPTVWGWPAQQSSTTGDSAVGSPTAAANSTIGAAAALGGPPVFVSLTPGAVVLVKDPDAPQRSAAAQAAETEAIKAAVAAEEGSQGLAVTLKDAAAEQVAGGFVPGIVTGTMLQRGMVSVCLGFEPCMSDIAVHVDACVPLRTRAALTSVLAAKKAHVELVRSGALGKMTGKAAGGSAARSASDAAASPTTVDMDDFDDRDKDPSRWVRSRLNRLSAKAPSAPCMLWSEQPCGGSAGLSLLHAVVHWAACGAVGGGGSGHALVVCSDPAAIVAIRDTVDAISENLAAAQAVGGGGGGNGPRLMLPCALVSLGDGPQRSRRISGRLSTSAAADSGALSRVWCCSHADVVFALGERIDVDAAHDAKGRLPGFLASVSSGPLLVVAGDARFSTSAAVAELEAAASAAGRACDHLGDQPALGEPAPSSQVVRIVTPLSLRQARRIQALVQHEWGQSPWESALTTGDQSADLSADLAEHDSRIYALTCILSATLVNVPQYGRLSPACRRCCLVVPESFYSNETLSLLLGMAVHGLNPRSTRREANAALSRWIAHRLFGALVVRVPDEDAAGSGALKAEIDDGEEEEMKPAAASGALFAHDAPLAMAVLARASVIVSFGAVAEQCVSRWLDGVRCRTVSTFAVQLDVEAALAAMEADPALSRPDRVKRVVVSRVWDGALELGPGSAAMRAEYSEHAESRARRGGNGGRPEMPRRLQPGRAHASPSAAAGAFAAFDDEHPIAAELRETFAASGISPSSLEAIAS